MPESVNTQRRVKEPSHPSRKCRQRGRGTAPPKPWPSPPGARDTSAQELRIPSALADPRCPPPELRPPERRARSRPQPSSLTRTRDALATRAPSAPGELTCEAPSLGPRAKGGHELPCQLQQEMPRVRENRRRRGNTHQWDTPVPSASPELSVIAPHSGAPHSGAVTSQGSSTSAARSLAGKHSPARHRTTTLSWRTPPEGHVPCRRSLAPRPAGRNAQTRDPVPRREGGFQEQGKELESLVTTTDSEDLLAGALSSLLRIPLPPREAELSFRGTRTQKLVSAATGTPGGKAAARNDPKEGSTAPQDSPVLGPGGRKPAAGGCRSPSPISGDQATPQLCARGRLAAAPAPPSPPRRGPPLCWRGARRAEEGGGARGRAAPPPPPGKGSRPRTRGFSLARRPRRSEPPVRTAPALRSPSAPRPAAGGPTTFFPEIGPSWLRVWPRPGLRGRTATKLRERGAQGHLTAARSISARPTHPSPPAASGSCSAPCAAPRPKCGCWERTLE
ncbi:uncharacterized protein [Castor canadensis]|uniref:Uncharacterized protein n=1 Tax=Castor canadensis TaxID=51338 RepID=A0AC58KWT1_CASCN